MRSNHEEQGAPTPGSDHAAAGTPDSGNVNEAEAASGGEQPVSSEEPQVAAEPSAPAESSSYGYDAYGNYEDPYAYPYGESSTGTVVAEPTPPATAAAPAPPTTPPPPAATEEEEDGADDGMLRMSFLQHLEELRTRLIRAILGVVVAYGICLAFAEQLWLVVRAPAAAALTELGFKDAKLAQLSPMEAFSVIWLKLPLLAAVFLASPWVLYQVWAFIAPGLYKRERRWAAPFVICSAGLFILGGVFAYFVAFRFGLVFLLGVGRDIGVLPLVSISEYFALFVNVMLGIGVVFELPVVIFFLTLLRIASPGFLLRNSRYAILAIVCIAAIITPTPDVFNLMLFSVPMVVLFFLGLFASYLLVLTRERKRFPWHVFLGAIGLPILIFAGGISLAVLKYGYKLVPSWPFLVR